MAKVIAEKVQEQVQVDSPKMVEIKHTRTMQDASGNNVEVVDYTESKSVDEAILEAEARLVEVEAEATQLKADIVEYKKIKG